MRGCTLGCPQTLAAFLSALRYSTPINDFDPYALAISLGAISSLSTLGLLYVMNRLQTPACNSLVMYRRLKIGIRILGGVFCLVFICLCFVHSQPKGIAGATVKPTVDPGDTAHGSRSSISPMLLSFFTHVRRITEEPVFWIAVSSFSVVGLLLYVTNHRGISYPGHGLVTEGRLKMATSVFFVLFTLIFTRLCFVHANLNVNPVSQPPPSEIHKAVRLLKTNLHIKTKPIIVLVVGAPLFLLYFTRQLYSGMRRGRLSDGARIMVVTLFCVLGHSDAKPATGPHTGIRNDSGSEICLPLLDCMMYASVIAASVLCITTKGFTKNGATNGSKKRVKLNYADSDPDRLRSVQGTPRKAVGTIDFNNDGTVGGRTSTDEPGVGSDFLCYEMNQNQMATPCSLPPPSPNHPSSPQDLRIPHQTAGAAPDPPLRVSNPDCADAIQTCCNEGDGNWKVYESRSRRRRRRKATALRTAPPATVPPPPPPPAGPCRPKPSVGADRCFTHTGPGHWNSACCQPCACDRCGGLGHRAHACPSPPTATPVCPSAAVNWAWEAPRGLTAARRHPRTSSPAKFKTPVSYEQGSSRPGKLNTPVSYYRRVPFNTPKSSPPAQSKAPVSYQRIQSKTPQSSSPPAQSKARVSCQPTKSHTLISSPPPAESKTPVCDGGVQLQTPLFSPRAKAKTPVSCQPIQSETQLSSPPVESYQPIQSKAPTSSPLAEMKTSTSYRRIQSHTPLSSLPVKSKTSVPCQPIQSPLSSPPAESNTLVFHQPIQYEAPESSSPAELKTPVSCLRIPSKTPLSSLPAESKTSVCYQPIQSETPISFLPAESKTTVSYQRIQSKTLVSYRRIRSETSLSSSLAGSTTMFVPSQAQQAPILSMNSVRHSTIFSACLVEDTRILSIDSLGLHYLFRSQRHQHLINRFGSRFR